MGNGIVAVPRAFFVRERNQLYSNWKFAFFRELFQNSVDARAVLIEVVIVDLGDGTCSVRFDDDGTGMDETTFTTVYFRLGESTKDVEADRNVFGRVGGFGRARILTHFSMPDYEITTLNVRVRGSGAEYELTIHDETVTGCRMRIHVDASADEMLMNLKNYLSCSQLGCHVTVNGETWSMWALKRQHVTDLTINGATFASVYVADNGIVGFALIRVKGTTMFTERIKGSKQVVVEIDPEWSRVVLTGNRDGFHEEYAAEVRRWFNTLSANPLSTLKKRRTPIIQQFPRAGVYCTVHNSLVVDPIGIDDIEGDVYLVSEMEPYETQTLFDQFDPAKSRLEFVFRCWVRAIAEIIPHALRLERHPSMQWTCGWYFGDEVAKFIMMGDVALFCLNPYTEAGRPRYDGGRTENIRELIATAKHEVAHFFHLDHDEAFSGLLSSLDSERTIAADSVKNAVIGQRMRKRLDMETNVKLDGKSMRLLQVIRDHGAISRRSCINTIWTMERERLGDGPDAEKEAMGLTAGSHHWSHPLFTKFKQSGYLEPTGATESTNAKHSRSQIYRLTSLGLRVLEAAETALFA